MTRISTEDAQARLAELIGELRQGEEMVITQGDRVVARIVGERSERRERPGPGLAKGIFSVVADDEGYLEVFNGYMP